MASSKPSAATFAAQGSKFLGTPYKEMDCQAFVEAMLRNVGINKDYKGSNAMFRDCSWVGTPEEAVKKFGSVPVGALLFILKFDGGEVARGYKDGLGNADHVGVKTGTGLGAIHSSSTRKCVAESEFHDKTIPNGGWNRVGLFNPLDYGIDIDATDQPSTTAPSQQGTQAQPSATSTPGAPTVTASSTATVYAENGKPVKMRSKPSTSCNLYWPVPVGSTVTVRGPESNGWTPVRWDGRDGYMMSQFLTAAEQQATIPDIEPDTQDTAPEEDGETYSSYAVEFYDLTLEQSQALQAMFPMYHSRIEGRNG